MKEFTRIEEWMMYSPLLYSQLIMSSAPVLQEIHNTKFLQGLV